MCKFSKQNNPKKAKANFYLLGILYQGCPRSFANENQEYLVNNIQCQGNGRKGKQVKPLLFFRANEIIGLANKGLNHQKQLPQWMSLRPWAPVEMREQGSWPFSSQ